jgi:hypothetical protein
LIIEGRVGRKKEEKKDRRKRRRIEGREEE